MTYQKVQWHVGPGGNRRGIGAYENSRANLPSSRAILATVVFPQSNIEARSLYEYLPVSYRRLILTASASERVALP